MSDSTPPEIPSHHDPVTDAKPPTKLPTPSSQQKPGSEPPPRGSNTVAIGLLTLLALFILTLIGLLEWRHNPAHPRLAREYVGTVQKITYVGGWGIRTQVETERQTLLLRGAAMLNQGDRLERHEGFLVSEVCDLDSGSCWDLLGR